MRIFNKRITKTITAVLVVTALVGLGMSNLADARTAYDPNGTPTSTTPIFNEFYNVPGSVGDEADFVRVRANGGTNADYISTLNGACNVNDKYDVRTYVHNGADPNYNNGGSGTAVAHDVVVAMQAELAKADSEFDFKSTISASNAASVSDTALLKCGTKNVKLNLVKNSVQTYSKPLGFQTAPDSAVNGTLKIGSQVQGSGDVWGCWDDRVIITYTVVVEVVPIIPPEVPHALTCKMEANREGLTVAVAIQPVATNVTVKTYKIDFNDGTVVDERTATHTYTTYGEHKVVGTVTGEGSDNKQYTANCEYKFSEDKPAQKLECEMIVERNGLALGAAIKPIVTNVNPDSLNYSINFNDGDGSVFNTQTAQYIYKDYGDHKVTGTVTGTGIDGSTKLTANCEYKFTEDEPEVPPVEPPVPPEPPVVPPVEPETPDLPDTGAASMVGIVSAVSVLGAIGHRVWIVRRVQ